jgi:hypothetical protein
MDVPINKDTAMSDDIKEVDLHSEVIDITLEFFEQGNQCIEHSVPSSLDILIQIEDDLLN